MAALTQARIDYRPFLTTGDPVERLVALAVADRVLDVAARNSEQRTQNMAILIGNRVGAIVGQALVAIAKAMRG